MKETRYKADPKQPYGLHDCHINGMTISNDDLMITFEDKFTQINESGVPGLNVHGNIVIEGIDSDFCDVIIQGEGGSMGAFRGERLTIPEFTEKYKEFRFEVINEYYGWQRLQYVGWLWMPDTNPKDITLIIGYFKGDVVYNTEE